MSDGSIRVVVADDDDRLREMLVGLLEDLGYVVVGAYLDGASAIAQCDTDRPDVVLLDHRMPVMSGSEATKALHTRHPELPVVILSAYDDPGLQSAASAAGAVAYLVKGCTAAEITRTLDTAVRQAGETSHSSR